MGSHRLALTLAVVVILIGACSADPSPSIVVSRSPDRPPPIEGASDWVRFRLYTHCGLDRSVIEFDGEYWEAIGPGPLSDGAGNPPSGFGNPFDDGWIVRISPDEAGYQSSQGVPLFLRRLEEPPQPGICV